MTEKKLFEPDFGTKNTSSIIKVIGIGGGGGNAVKHMYKDGIQGVDFLICNTDRLALERNPIPEKLVLGESGLGAGANPEVARQLAEESRDEIVKFIGLDTKMLFLTAGMGKGTGTGATPIVAQIARDMGILTVAVVTEPFRFEGQIAAKHAEDGIRELKKHVDSLIIVKNQNILKYYNDRDFDTAFGHADDVLKNAVKFTDSDLAKMGDNKLAGTCRNIVALAREKQPLMAGVGLTEALIDALDTSVADFEAKLLGTPQYIGEQKAAKQKREKAINACEEIMTNDLDMIVEILKHENPETYAEYQHARKVKMMGRRTMALKIKVVESNSKNRVPGVNITIVPDTNGDALKATADLTKTVKRTSALGGCQVKNLPEGKYLVTAEKAGWAPQSTVVYINAGEMSTAILELTAL